MGAESDGAMMRSIWDSLETMDAMDKAVPIRARGQTMETNAVIARSLFYMMSKQSALRWVRRA